MPPMMIALGHERPHDRAVGRAERLEDGDLLRLLGHHQEQRAHDAEARDDDLDRQDEKRRDPLELQRAEEVLVDLAPVADDAARGRSTAATTRGRQPVGALGVVDLHLDRRDLARRRRSSSRPRRASCRRASRRTRTCRCRRSPAIRYLRVLRHHAHGAEIAERRDERHLVADVDVERLRELAARRRGPVEEAGASRTARTAGSRSSPSGGRSGPFSVLLAAGPDADHLVWRDVAQELGVLEVGELVLDADRRLDVLAQIDDVCRWSPGRCRARRRRRGSTRSRP